MDADRYESPLASRYAGKAMAALFTPLARARAWRDVWIALAEVEHELGAPVTKEQLAALRRTRDAIDLARVAEIEKETRHDVVAHIRAWGEKCPEAKPVIHLGATSMFVTDNADALLFRSALGIIRDRVVNLARALVAFVRREADRTCLGYTHLQPAQPVTMGKRAALWLQDVVWDLDEVERVRAGWPCLGAKGATGTQASFVELFKGDGSKADELDRRVAEKLGFASTVALSGQTYPRKLDARIADALASMGVTLGKLSRDCRLLAHTGELREAFLPGQVGSSAMPYKRNPMRAERVSSLARLVVHLRDIVTETAAVQWLERSLDDSAARRIAMPDLFLATDGALRASIDLVLGLEVDADEVARRLEKEAPFLASEAIIARGVAAGGDRQELHERLRVHALASKGAGRDLLEKLASDPAFAKVARELPSLADPTRHRGRAAEQARAFADRAEAELARFAAKPFDDPLEV